MRTNTLRRSAIFLVAAALGLSAGQSRGSSTLLDISQSPYNATQGSANAATTTAAIQKAISDATAAGGGRVFIPSGSWYINQPLMMYSSSGTVELVGAGVGSASLYAVDGYKDMTMVMPGVPTEYSLFPIQTTNRVASTGILDSSVTTTVYGIRTCTDSPVPATPLTGYLPTVWTNGTSYQAGDFSYDGGPALVYKCILANTAGATSEPGVGTSWQTYWQGYPSNMSPNKYSWTAGNVYAVNDEAIGSDNATYGCTVAHTAASGNQPGTGGGSSYWSRRVSFGLHAVADPLAAGAKNTTNGRASDWADMTNFTVDLAFNLNTSHPGAGMPGSTIIAGVYGRQQFYVPAIWEVDYARDTYTVTGPGIGFFYTLGDGSVHNLWLAGANYSSGLYRLSLQITFDDTASGNLHGTHLQAWLQRPGESAFTLVKDANSVSDPSNLPAGKKFFRAQNAVFKTACYYPNFSSNPIGNNNILDETTFGVHESNILRYTANGSGNPNTVSGGTFNDSFRYFTNDTGTIAYLPLTDNPDATHVGAQGVFATVQHGDAAGDNTQKGYAFLFPGTYNPPGSLGYRVSDMTIVPGPVWGMGIGQVATLYARYLNLDIEGGFYAIGDFSAETEYTTSISNCTLAGTEAAIFGWQDIMAIKNVTISHCGRYGIFTEGVNISVYNSSFNDPVTHQTQCYYYNDQDQYGGGISFDGVTANAASGSAYPSQAAFTILDDATRMGVHLSNVSVQNMGSSATFLEIPYTGSTLEDFVGVHGCSYSGSSISSFLKTGAPNWSGRIYDCTANMPISKWIDWTAPTFTTWTSGNVYSINSYVTDAGKNYKCLASNLAASGTNEPGTSGGAAYWDQIGGAHIFQYQNTSTTPDTSKTWVVDRHIVTLTNKGSGTPSEDRCTASPSTFGGIKNVTGSAPSISATVPDTSNAAVGTLVSLSATVSDPDSTSTYNDVDHVEFFLDTSTTPFAREDVADLPTTTAAPATIFAQWRYDGSSHSFTAVAYDKYGHTASAVAASIPTNGLAGWWKADTITGIADGGAVSTWNDSSTGGNNATQSTGTNKPIYKAHGLGGQPSLQFSGSQWFTTALTCNFNDFTVLAVYQDDGSVGFAERIIDSYYLTGLELGRYSSTANSWTGDAKNTYAAVTLQDGQPHVIDATRSGTTLTTYGDGTTNSSTTVAAGVLSSDTLYIGRNKENTCFMGGQIAEVLVYNRALSSTERQAVEAYLTQKYHLFATNGLVEWVKADGITGKSDGNAVGTWSDVSGSSNNGTQGTGANQPIYKTNIINGCQPVLRFSGSQWLTTPLAGTFNDFTAMVVYKDDGTVNFAERLIDTYYLTGLELGRYSLSSNTWTFGVVNNFANVTLSDGSPHLIEGIRSGSTCTCIGDASTTNTSSMTVATGTLANFPLLIGTNHEGTCPLSGDIAEVLFWNRALSTSERQVVEAYLKAKYGF